MSNILSDEVKTLEYDVAVIGTGCGGLSSAIAAARQGCKVVIIEKNGFVGGLTASGIPYLGYLDIQKRLVLGGFATEFVDELIKDGATLGVRYCPKHLSIVDVMPDKVKLTAARLLKENGVDILLHTNLIFSEVEDRKIKKITCECCGTKIEIKAKTFVDATGDGTLAYLSGAEFEKGTAGVDLQPPSVIFTIGGVDKPAFFKWIEEHPEELGEGDYTMDYLTSSPDFCFVTLHKLWEKLYPLGEWPMGIWAMILINRLNDTEVGVNGPRMAATGTTDPISVTAAEILGQNQATQFVEMLRKYVGGFENAFVSHLNDNIGVRETRRVVGCQMLTLDDVTGAVIDENTVALGSYPIDIHGSKDFSSSFVHVDKPYGIPYLATVCRDIDNLTMGGRCISVDKTAYGSTRVMGTCFAVSEASGIGAGMAAKQGIAPKDVDIKEIRRVLKEHGAVLSID